MKIKTLHEIFRIFLFTLAILAITTCSSSKKTAGNKEMFKIPGKIVKAEDLPPALRADEQKPEHVVKLFSDETVAEPVAQNAEVPTKVIKTINEEKPQNPMLGRADDIVSKLNDTKPRPKYFHIVSGSFRNPLYANMFVKTLKHMGYGNTYVTFADNGFNRVIVQRYDNEVEARQYLDGYRNDNPQYASAWLFYLKNSGDESLVFTPSN